MEDNARDFVSEKVLYEPLKNLTIQDMVEAYSALSTLEKLMVSRKKKIRDTLLEELHKQAGDDSGKAKMALKGSSISYSTTTSKLPEEKEFVKLLQSNNINVDEVFDRVEVYELNMSKVERLIDIGRLKESEVKGLYTENKVFRVNPGKALKQKSASFLAVMNEDQ
jgi:hypothetical protein